MPTHNNPTPQQPMAAPPCRPVPQAYPTESWMEYFAKRQLEFRNKTLLDLTIPGSHDAATYTMQAGEHAGLLATLARPFTVTQTCSLLEQFKLGIRYFDIRITRAFSSANDPKSLVFFHGVATSAKNVVFPELKAFLDHIRTTKEIVILKFHFKKHEDFRLLLMEFGDIFYIGSLESFGVITPDQVPTQSVSNLMEEGKQFLVLTHNGGNDTPHVMNYKSSTAGGWSKTRDWERLAAHMEKAQLDNTDNLEKLKIIQTNQPALVGSGNSRFSSVLKHESKPESRNIINRFIEQSKDRLKEALESQNESDIAEARQIIRGIISLDNIGADPDKNLLVLRIIELNDDPGLEASLGITRL